MKKGILLFTVLVFISLFCLALAVVWQDSAGDPPATGEVTPSELTSDTPTEPVQTGEQTAEPASDASDVTEEPTSPVTDPPATEPVTEPVTQARTEPVTEPVTQARTEPVTAPVTKPVTEPQTSAPTVETAAGFVPVSVPGATRTGTTPRGYAIEELDGNTYVGGILIANKSYTLSQTYIPSIYTKTDWTVELLPEAQAAFTAMQAAFAAECPKEKGFKVQSGYRSYTYQGGLYDRYVQNNGKEKADTFSARPGHSEHQTGLAADINVKGTSTLYDSIKDTPEGKWLAAESWRFGFILRYPKGKETETGYQFEPWHFRYIGPEAARAVYESCLTLEEFLGIDSVYRD